MDCHICLEKKSSLKSLPCSHELCLRCYVRLDQAICPFCRAKFNYSTMEIKERTKLGLQYGYQSNNTAPGLELPDDIVLDNSGGLLNNFNSNGVILAPELLNRRNQHMYNVISNMEDRYASTRSHKKNKKYNMNLHQNNCRLTVDEINDRRYNIVRRETRKWFIKERRLEKLNSWEDYD